MSKNAVNPPAASAALPVARPSQCVRPGLVEVHVRVEPAREHVQAGRVDLPRRAARELRLDGGDQAVGHADVGRAHAARR